jgi:hypothetical protein
VRRARRGYRAARRRVGRLAGRVNQQVARQLTAISKAASAAQALLSDGTRQRYLYRRWYALVTAPESAGDLWGPPAPSELPRPVLDLLEYPEHVRTGSNLEPLESVTLNDLDTAWESLQGQAQDDADAARQPGHERRPAPASPPTLYPLNGVSRGLASVHDPSSGGGES